MSRPRQRALAPPSSERARRSAAAILEVLAGLRTPAEASQALGVGANRYYQLEARGLEGLVRALEPVLPGRRRRPEAEVEHLRREKARAERETSRYQALLRASHKALGLAALSHPRGDSKGGKARRPRVRARRAIQALERVPEAPAATSH